MNEIRYHVFFFFFRAGILPYIASGNSINNRYLFLFSLYSSSFTLYSSSASICLNKRITYHSQTICQRNMTGAAFPDLMTLDLRPQLLDRAGLNLIAHCHDRFYLRCSHGKVQTARPGIFHCCHHHIAFDCLFPASK